MSDLEEKLQKRLADFTKKRASHQSEIKKLQHDIQRLVNKIPRRPKKTLGELNKKISDLEHKRTTTSVSLAEERQILKQINIIKKIKIETQEYHLLEKEIQERRTSLNRLRDAQKLGKESIQEMEAALNKVKLAGRLGCNTQELTISQIECPKEKVGLVIGKNGSRIKEIMKATKVMIDVDKKTNMVQITGSPSSVANARIEIEKITRAVDVEIELPKHVASYLSCRHMDEIAVIKQKYNGIYLEILRNSGKAIIRGDPELAEAAKNAILAIELVSKERLLAGREFNHLLGKKGATIDNLVSAFKVFIDVQKVDDETAFASIVGPPMKVEEVMDQIDELMNDNKEVAEGIPIDIIIKRILLHGSGSRIKALQSQVNSDLKLLESSCSLSFPKDEVDKENPELLVKAKQSIIGRALELTLNAMKEIQELVTTLTVDAYIIPRIIGKGGESVRKLTGGKPCFLEVDRNTGKIVLGATTVKERDSLLEEVRKLITDNTVLRIKGDPALIRTQYRELSRSKVKASIQELAWLDIDEKNAVFILRGNQNNIEKAKHLLDEFVIHNFVDELHLSEEDQDALLIGGKQSKIMKLSEENGVNLYVDRNKHVMSLRGPRENVTAVKQKLNRFLVGGEGYTVAKLSATEQVVGAIIGKGGKTRKDLETKFSPVSIHISKSHRVSIRGPDDKVKECRIAILKMIASARVSQTIEVSGEQQENLRKNDVLKRIMQQSHAQVLVIEGKAVIRGSFYDVRDAVSLLDEQLTGKYTSRIELDSSQFARVASACRDKTHFGRMETSTGACVALEDSSSSVKMSGKRSAVKKVKEMVYGFIGFVCPGEIARQKIQKPLYATVAQASSLAEVAAAAGGVTLYLDRDIGAIIIQDSDSEKVVAASKLLLRKILDAECLAYVLEFTPADAWLISYIIGKNGSRIQALQKGSECYIDVSKESRTITATGQTEDTVSQLRQKLDALVDKGRRENHFITIPEKAIPIFVGKGGKNIKELSKELNVDIQRLRRSARFKIAGNEMRVNEALERIQAWLAEWDQSNSFLQIPLEKKFIPAILGQGGSIAKKLQDDFGCKIDINREALLLTVRGGTEENRQITLTEVKGIISNEKAFTDEGIAPRSGELTHSNRMVDGGKNFSISSEAKLDCRDNRNEEVSIRENKYPVQPVGVQNSKRIGKQSSRFDKSVQEGTEQGRSLFNLLVKESDV